MIAEEIPSALAGQRLDRVVSLVAEVSRAEAARLIDGGFVRLDGATAAAGKERLREGQRLEVDTSGISVPRRPGPEPGVVFSVVHADDHLLVVDKPARLVVHPATGNETGTLVNGLLARYPELAQVGQPERPGIVHRLDGGTSGLLLVARTQPAYEALVEMLREHEVERVYDALVWGDPESPSGLIDAPIGRDPRDPLKMAVVGSGRASRTRYHVECRFESPLVSLLTCRLETGRTHQIRVHLAAIGHPVVADHQYAGRRPALGLERPFLHARRLQFVHPFTGVTMVFDAPMPDDLNRALAELA
ncbi:MAG: RluA family pseudouridine synthase [Ilumatobacteraceae bacterium]